MLKMRMVMLTSISFVLTGLVVGNAYYQKKQFYPSVVYITKSNPSMAVLYVQAFVFVILMGKMFRKIFFGQLRAAEMEHLVERSWYAVTETCLAFTVFRDDFSSKFVALFTLLLFLKCFHWLAEDRVDFMERSPVISFLFHARVLSLLGVLSAIDLYFMNHAYYSTLIKGASVQLVFGFEYAVLLTIVFMAAMKYILHSIDLQSENPWENKAVYLLYTELILGFVKVVLYMAFMIIMIKVHTFPLFAIRPMYLSLRGFKKAVHDVIMSRRAIRNMNTLYLDATPEELQSGDNVCIICREEMVEACKKLPCNHIFHTSCLRSWFQRQQTCPTCRSDVLQMPRPVQPQPPAAPQPQQPQPFQNMFPGYPGMPIWPPAAQQPPAQAGAQAAAPPPAAAPPGAPPVTVAPPTSTTAASSFGASANVPGVTTPQIPPFMPMFPSMFMNSFPRPPPNMSGLSAEELRAMEGQERENIEARIQWLRDIQALLDGAMLLINQYNTVAAQSSISGIQTNVQYNNNSSTAASSSSTYTALPTEGSGGARPKYSSPAANTDTSSTSKSKSFGDSVEDVTTLEGATGYTPPKEELIPEWEDPTTEEHKDEMDEVRRRRLQHFSSTDDTQEKTTVTADSHQD